jgi:hypothetical protein
MKKTSYRIQNEDGTFLNVGTDLASWFNLEDARKTVSHKKGQRIIEHNGYSILWEVL